MMQPSDQFRTLCLDSSVGGNQPSSLPLQNTPKPKRRQVARACVWCRLNRVRCDNHIPCRNCRERNQECRRQERPKPLTLPLALAEIEKLKSQISDLEKQQRHPSGVRGKNTAKQKGDEVKNTAELENRRTSARFGQSDNFGSHGLSDGSHIGDRSLSCRGIMTESSIGIPQHFYGLSSVQNLVHNLKTYLYLAYGWIYNEEDLHPKPITLSLSSSSELGTGVYSTPHRSPGEEIEGVFMGKEQEEECLRLFWETYHCAIPILDERKFLDHHSSLWRASSRPDQYRDDSALVDVVLAICVQYGMTHLQGHVESAMSASEYEITDPSNAGRWYFQRSQSLLRAELDKPSITLLQCQILSIVYLRDASLLNLALSSAASAVQTAYALGLHMEVTWLSDTHESELLKRLWCMVFALEGKMSMDCGRPFLAQMLHSRLPHDSHEFASSSDEMFVPSSKLKVTWLTYHVEHIKLMQISRKMFTKAYDSIAHLLAADAGQKFGQNLELVQQCDELLVEELAPLKLWLERLPRELQCDLIISQNAMAEDDPLANVKQQDYLWLQRQRVMLRLLYHDICISLCRAFVIFPSPNGSTSAPTQSAAECLHHAMAITDIAYKVLKDSDILYGWHRAYQFQWNAALLMVAFAFANLSSPYINAIVVRLEHAIFVLDTFGRCFAVARSATEIIRKLYDKLHIASG